MSGFFQWQALRTHDPNMLADGNDKPRQHVLRRQQEIVGCSVKAKLFRFLQGQKTCATCHYIPTKKNRRGAEAFGVTAGIPFQKKRIALFQANLYSSCKLAGRHRRTMACRQPKVLTDKEQTLLGNAASRRCSGCWKQGGHLLALLVIRLQTKQMVLVPSH